MIFPWKPPFTKIFPWFPHDFPMKTSIYKDFPMISPWFSHENLHLQRFSHEFPIKTSMYIQRFSHGFPRIFPWKPPFTFWISQELDHWCLWKYIDSRSPCTTFFLVFTAWHNLLTPIHSTFSRHRFARLSESLRKPGQRIDVAEWGDADASLMGPNGPSFIGKVFRDPMSAKAMNISGPNFLT